jgi:midasin (ATPase involved in ribosome maturation)
MAIDFKSFLKVVPFVTDIRKPVLLRGRHGIGKSELVYQYALMRNMSVVERRASQMTEGDLMGLPSIEGNSTRWNAPDWLKEACDNGVVLFLDEVDRATQEVRQGIFELTDSRKLNGWHLHRNTLIFAAVNGGEHGSQYQVGEMDPAELDRWTVFDVEPSIEDWLDHAKGKVLPIVWDFINQDRAHLEFKGEYEPNKVFPSRRSWFRLNDCLATGKLLEGSSKDFKHNLGTVFELATAFVGFEAAVKFRDFAEKYESQVTVDDIMNGRHDAMETWGINDHVSMIDKVIASEVLKKPLDAKTIKHLADWGRRMPGEALMKLWKSVGPQNIKNAVNLHNALGNHIVEIMTGGNAEKAPEKK